MVRSATDSCDEMRSRSAFTRSVEPARELHQQVDVAGEGDAGPDFGHPLEEGDQARRRRGFEPDEQIGGDVRGAIDDVGTIAADDPIRLQAGQPVAQRGAGRDPPWPPGSSAAAARRPAGGPGSGGLCRPKGAWMLVKVAVGRAKRAVAFGRPSSANWATGQWVEDPLRSWGEFHVGPDDAAAQLCDGGGRRHRARPLRAGRHA